MRFLAGIAREVKQVWRSRWEMATALGYYFSGNYCVPSLNDWTGGITAGVAWLMFLQVKRRLSPLTPAPEDESAARCSR